MCKYLSIPRNWIYPVVIHIILSVLLWNECVWRTSCFALSRLWRESRCCGWMLELHSTDVASATPHHTHHCTNSYIPFLPVVYHIYYATGFYHMLIVYLLYLPFYMLPVFAYFISTSHFLLVLVFSIYSHRLVNDCISTFNQWPILWVYVRMEQFFSWWILLSCRVASVLRDVEARLCWQYSLKV